MIAAAASAEGKVIAFRVVAVVRVAQAAGMSRRSRNRQHRGRKAAQQREQQ
jgi:hypothetical protein